MRFQRLSTSIEMSREHHTHLCLLQAFQPQALSNWLWALEVSHYDSIEKERFVVTNNMSVILYTSTGSSLSMVLESISRAGYFHVWPNVNHQKERGLFVASGSFWRTANISVDDCWMGWRLQQWKHTEIITTASEDDFEKGRGSNSSSCWCDGCERSLFWQRAEYDLYSRKREEITLSKEGRTW